MTTQAPKVLATAALHGRTDPLRGKDRWFAGLAPEIGSGAVAIRPDPEYQDKVWKEHDAEVEANTAGGWAAETIEEGDEREDGSDEGDDGDVDDGDNDDGDDDGDGGWDDAGSVASRFSVDSQPKSVAAVNEEEDDEAWAATVALGKVPTSVRGGKEFLHYRGVENVITSNRNAAGSLLLPDGVEPSDMEFSGICPPRVDIEWRRWTSGDNVLIDCIATERASAPLGMPDTSGLGSDDEDVVRRGVVETSSSSEDDDDDKIANDAAVFNGPIRLPAHVRLNAERVLRLKHHRRTGRAPRGRRPPSKKAMEAAAKEVTRTVAVRDVETFGVLTADSDWL